MKGKKKISEEKKWQIVAYHKLGMNDSKISSLVNVSPTCIKTTIRDWTNNGSVKSLSGAGCPRKTSPKDDAKLFNLVRRSPESSLSELNSKWMTADGSPSF
jgi:transposase